jgi:N6-adenosine-specific RNA methylase IME4
LTDEERNSVEFVTQSGEIFWKSDLEDDEDLPEPPRIISIQVAKPEQVAKVAAQAQSTIEKAAPETVARLAANDINLVQAQREVKEQVREQRREENRVIVQQTAPLADVNARFATIVIDPPWDWGDEGDVDQMGRARPDYATMPYEKMLELPVADRADMDCHLYLWITNRSLPKGFALLEAWGFRYITCLTWVKPSFGLGNYFRGQSEQVLFGVKGSQPLKRKDAPTVFYAPRGLQGHSSKPIEFYEFVESCSPGPYLEIFSRQERNDWTAWGEVVA